MNAHPPKGQQAGRGWRRVLWVFFAIAYCVAFYYMWFNVGAPAVKRTVIVISIIPIVLIANVKGRRAGIVTGLLFIPINLIMLYLGGDDFIYPPVGAFFWIGQAVFIIIGGFVGYVSSLRQKLKKELAYRSILEQSRQNREDRFRAIAEYGTDITIIIDEDLKRIDISPSITSRTGYSIDELDRNLYEILLDPDQSKEILDTCRQVLKVPGKIIEFPGVRVRHKDGHWMVFDCNIANLTHVEDIKGVAIIGHEITELINTQEALKQSEINYRALFHQTNDGIMLVALDGTLVDINQRAADMLGYSPGEMIGKNITQFMSASDQKDREQKLARLARTGFLPVYERTLTRSDGDPLQIEINLTNVYGATGEPLYRLSTFRDISVRKAAENELIRLATHDPLTNIPNRRIFFDRLSHAIARSERHQAAFAVLFIDLDDFKLVNDNLGHAAGDVLLNELATRMYESLRAEDTIARMGGDEFAAILEKVNNRDEVREVVARLMKTLEKPFYMQDQEIQVGISLGISMYPDDGLNTETLLNRADNAMYSAKSSGKNTFRFYDET
jgi:diguanylate cyclase (GGDEF)-like protein/PAS domain S-box-containing protein